MVTVVVLSPSFSRFGLLLGLVLVWGFRVNRDRLGLGFGVLAINGGALAKFGGKRRFGHGLLLVLLLLVWVKNKLI